MPDRHVKMPQPWEWPRTRSVSERTVEVSFEHEIESLRLGEGDTFHGEGILAITKALLQSGVAYVAATKGRRCRICSM